MKQPIVLVLIASPFISAGDTLSDLRRTLERFPATAPFAALGRVQVNAAAQEDAGRAGEGGFEIESAPSGFTIRISPKTLAASDREAAAKKTDPNAPTPTRTAMVALTVFDIMDAVDAPR
jgi:hypothetical protein